MQFNKNLSILCTLLLLATIQVCHAEKQLMCYVCEGCGKITESTPQIECNADYFNGGGTTLPAIMTTTTNDPTIDGGSSTTTPMSSTDQSTTQSTTADASSSSTTDAPTTTTDSTTQSTTESTSTTDMTSTTTIITTTTEEATTDTTASTTKTTAIPTPPTLMPPVTTESMPTPPNSGTTPAYLEKEVLSQGRVSDIMKNITTTPLSETASSVMGAHIRSVRQAVTNNDYTYHCYSVQKKNGTNTWITERGCSRVTTMQSVCGLLETENSNTTIRKCDPCSMPRCNSGTALHVSLSLTLFVAAVATFLHYN